MAMRNENPQLAEDSKWTGRNYFHAGLAFVGTIAITAFTCNSFDWNPLDLFRGNKDQAKVSSLSTDTGKGMKKEASLENVVSDSGDKGIAPPVDALTFPNNTVPNYVAPSEDVPGPFENTKPSEKTPFWQKPSWNSENDSLVGHPLNWDQSIIFQSDRNGKNQLFIKDRRDNPKQLEILKGEKLYEGEAKLPIVRGDTIFFMGLSEGRYDLCSSTLDGRGFKNHTQENKGLVSMFDVSLDGKTAVYRTDVGNTIQEIRVLDVENGQSRVLALTQGYGTPVISQKGDMVAYSSLNSIGDRQISIAFPQRNDSLVRTLPTNYNDINPAFSPDGSRIAFVRYQMGSSDICVVDPSGSNEMNLTQAQRSTNTYPAWFPNGERMAFVSDRWVEGLEGEGNRNYDIGIVDLDGTVQRLTDSPFDESMPTVSGDGNWIGYHVDHGENPFENTRNYEVWVAEAKGGGKAYNLTDNSGRDSFPCFYSAFQAPVTIQSKPQSIESPRTVPDAPMPVPIPPAPSSGPSF